MAVPLPVAVQIVEVGTALVNELLTLRVRKRAVDGLPGTKGDRARITALLAGGPVRTQPVGTVSDTANAPGRRSGNVFTAVPFCVVSENGPRALLANENVRSPPTVLLWTEIDPRWVLMNVQVTVTLAWRTIAPGVAP